MGVLDNINQGDIPDILRRLRALENRTTLNNSAIGRGGMEVYDGGVLNISNGGLVVNGSAQIIGTLNAEGTINMTGIFIASGEMQLNGTTVATGDFTIEGPLLVDGDTTFNGELHINGITDIAGDTTVTGKLDLNGPLNVKGDSTLTGTLTVTGNGQIKVGNVNLTPSASNGGIEFSSGGGVGANGGTVVVKGTGNAGLLASPTTTSIFSGPNSVDVTASAVTINGPLKATALPSTTNAPNLYFDPVTKQISYKP